MEAHLPSLHAGCYRLARTVHIMLQQNGGLAICSYPLRVLRLSALTTSLLLQCREQQTCEQLAQHLDLSTKRVQALCEQLRWKGLLDAGPSLPPVTWPSVSIIIPTHNRSQQLERCLISLLALDYPPQCLELIVVDDASTDHTATMLQRLVHNRGRDFDMRSRSFASLRMTFASSRLHDIQIIRHTQRQGVARSRNTGTEAAHHDLLAFIDSDCIASPGWLAELVPAFQDTQLGAVGGMIRAYDCHSILGRYEDTCSSLFMGTRPQQVRLEGPLTYLPTANLLLRRLLWHKLGGFAPLAFGEDVDFCYRLLASESQSHIVYLPQGIVYHDYRTTVPAFLGTRISYASSEAALLRHHPTQRRTLLLLPEQTGFAVSLIGGLWLSTKLFLVGFLLILFGTFTRWQKVYLQNIPLNPFIIFLATIRGHLAYSYHLCRHLTRYYTLPLMIIGLLLPPILLLVLTLYSIVIGVDYIRLHPRMSPAEFILCSLLDDCAYEIGVVLGCIKHRNWKPLLPLIHIKMKNR